LLPTPETKVLQFKDVSKPRTKQLDPPISLNERAFLQWEDINFFVPTDVDPMTKVNFIVTKTDEYGPESNFNTQVSTD
jgi:hypothetical protein